MAKKLYLRRGDINNILKNYLDIDDPLKGLTEKMEDVNFYNSFKDTLKISLESLKGVLEEESSLFKKINRLTHFKQMCLENIVEVQKTHVPVVEQFEKIKDLLDDEEQEAYMRNIVRSIGDTKNPVANLTLVVSIDLLLDQIYTLN